jgi:hypothetical protein
MTKGDGMIKGEPSEKRAITVILNEKEWIAMLDILNASQDKRSPTLYQKVGNQVIL